MLLPRRGIRAVVHPFWAVDARLEFKLATMYCWEGCDCDPKVSCDDSRSALFLEDHEPCVLAIWAPCFIFY